MTGSLTKYESVFCIYVVVCLGISTDMDAHIDYLISRYKCRKMESHYIRTLACRIKIGLGRGGGYVLVCARERGGDADNSYIEER